MANLTDLSTANIQDILSQPNDDDQMASSLSSIANGVTANSPLSAILKGVVGGVALTKKGQAQTQRQIDQQRLRELAQHQIELKDYQTKVENMAASHQEGVQTGMQLAQGIEQAQLGDESGIKNWLASSPATQAMLKDRIGVPVESAKVSNINGVDVIQAYGRDANGNIVMDPNPVPVDAYLKAYAPEAYAARAAQRLEATAGQLKNDKLAADARGAEARANAAEHPEQAAPQGPAATAGEPGSTATGDDFLKTLDPSTSAQVKALAEGRSAFPTGTALKSAYWQQMLDNVAKYDPNFDAVNYNARAKTRSDFTSGKSATTINAINTAIGHLQTLSKAADGLNNTSIPLVNKALNAAVSATGSPQVAKFKAAVQPVVEELTKVYRGTGGNEADIQDRKALLDAASSPEQLHGAIAQMAELLESKVHALGDQYNQGMGTTKNPLSLVTSKSAKILNDIRVKAGEEPVTVEGDATQAAPAAAAPVPEGSTATNPKTGAKVVFKGGQWVPLK